ncbi:uncharacterized protein METZ01_LOCUS407136, partial [marine metagenome]
MNGLTSMQVGVPLLMVVLIAPLVILLVATILFRAATKRVTNQDISFWISLGIVLLGAIAAIVSSLVLTIPLTLTGAPEITVVTIGFTISFCVTSWIYLLILNKLLIQNTPDKYKELFKINFWKASLIQLIMFLLLALIAGLGLI